MFHLIALLALRTEGAPQGLPGHATKLQASAEAAALAHRHVVNHAVVSNDGKVVFVPARADEASAVSLPDFKKIRYQHASTYRVQLLNNNLRAVAFTPGQIYGDTDPASLPPALRDRKPYPLADELGATLLSGGLFAAATRTDWIDVRAVALPTEGGGGTELVVSKFGQTEAVGGRNTTGLIEVPTNIRPVAATYDGSGMPVATMAVLSSRTHVQFRTFVLDDRGRLTPWRKPQWPTFEIKDTDDWTVAGSPLTLVAAVCDGEVVHTCDNGGHYSKLEIPAGVKSPKLAVMGSHVFLYPDPDKKPKQAHLYLIESGKWVDVGEFVPFAWSANGRIMLVRSSDDSSWWRLDLNPN